LFRGALIVVAVVLTAGARSGNESSLVQPMSTTILTSTPPWVTLIPLAPASVGFAGRTTGTGTAGMFFHRMPSGSTSQRLLTGAGIVARSLLRNRLSARNATMSVAGFDLDFYRSLVRDGLEVPITLEPLRRWTRTPMIYLKTVDEAGVDMDMTTLATVEATIKDAIPKWTSRRLGAPLVERGPGTREGQSGWITIKFPPPNTEEGHCGRAQIAVDGGWIELYYARFSTAATHCRVGGAIIAPRTVRHEIGHALGFFHSDSPNDVMFGGDWFSSQSNQDMSIRELAAAAIAYSRPVGTADPDVDPSSAVSVAPMHVP
jgi:hypothetical protein